MKILLANYRYFLSGGPETYMFNFIDEMIKLEHKVIPFSIKSILNNHSDYSKYFASPIGNLDEVYFSEHKFSLNTYFNLIKRLFYDNNIENLIHELIIQEKPDIAYILHYLRKISPSLLVGIKKNNIPIFVRLSDYMMLCPQAHFIRNNSPCTLCTNNRLNSIKFKCVKNSYLLSAVEYASYLYHNNRNFFDLIDKFICTNYFMIDVMKKSGFSENRLEYVPTFVDLQHFNPSNKKENYIFFSGRLETIKGVDILIEAFSILKHTYKYNTYLIIAGTGEKNYVEYLKNLSNKFNVTNETKFLGHISFEILPEYYRKAMLTVIPSICFENLPNVFLESIACGTPVIASNIGSFKEIVNNNCGALFNPRSPHDLANNILEFLTNPNYSAICDSCRIEASNNFSAHFHINKILELFNSHIY